MSIIRTQRVRFQTVILLEGCWLGFQVCRDAIGRVSTRFIGKLIAIALAVLRQVGGQTADRIFTQKQYDRCLTIFQISYRLQEFADLNVGR